MSSAQLAVFLRSDIGPYIIVGNHGEVERVSENPFKVLLKV